MLRIINGILLFLAVDPARENELRFTSPYLTIDCTLLVRSCSGIHSVLEMDREGVTINVGKGSAYSLPLIRTLKHARLCEYPTTQQALNAFLAGKGGYGGEYSPAAGSRRPGAR